MGVKVSFDETTRIIQVTQAPSLIDGEMKVQLDVQIDIYSDGKEDYLTQAGFPRVGFPVRVVGGDPLPGAKVLGDSYFIDSTWKIRPYEADHIFEVNGNVYSEDGTSPFVQTIGSYNVMVVITVSNLVDSTVQQLEEIEYASFGGGVTIDNVDGQSGTIYPIGTREFPSDNWGDTKAIAISRGFTDIFIKGAYTFGATDDISGYDFRALNVLASIVSLTPGVITTNTIFRNMSIQGTLNGKALIYESFILDLAGFNGTINRCGFLGTITLAGSTVCHMIRCYDGFEGFGEPIINFGGSGRGLNMRDYHGGLRLENKSGGEDVSIGLNGGRLEIAADVTNGEILVRGIGEISEDLGSATVVDRTVNKYSLDRILGLVQENQFIDNQVYTARKLTSARIRIYSVAGSVGTDSDVLATYTVTATYTGSELDSYKVVKA